MVVHDIKRGNPRKLFPPIRSCIAHHDSICLETAIRILLYRSSRAIPAN